MSHNFIDITGQTFNRLTAIKFENGKWLCKCACGGITNVNSYKLRTGHTKSCGCYDREKSQQRGRANRKHGMSDSKQHPEYFVWRGLKARCTNSNNPNYLRYGGRGIQVCERWINSFETFIADMGQRPSPVHQIDRIDYDGHYEPTNCRWVTPIEQQRNRSSNVQVTYKGKTQCLKAWAEEYGADYFLTWQRFQRGWSLEECLLIPITPRNMRHHIDTIREQLKELSC